MFCNNGECNSFRVEFKAGYEYCPYCGEELDSTPKDVEEEEEDESA